MTPALALWACVGFSVLATGSLVGFLFEYLRQERDHEVYRRWVNGEDDEK